MNYNKYASYLKGFASSPKSVGTVFPSSKFLCRAMIDQIRWLNKPLTIAELGSGDGVLTKHILHAMGEEDHLDSFEINPIFFPYLNQINDSRLTLYKHSADQLNDDYDLIFSCLPFLSLPIKLSISILKTAQIKLSKKEGNLILFQYTRRSERLLNHFFSWQRTRVYKNIPPAYVYTCQTFK